MKDRFNLLIPVVNSQGYRLARVSLDTSRLTEDDKNIILEHYLVSKIEKFLQNPVDNWKEGEFMTLDVKQFVPVPVQDDRDGEKPLDSMTVGELKNRLEEHEQKKQFLLGLKPGVRQKAEKLLKTYSLQEIRSVLKELRACS
jgi:hypothetical protein